ncbi:hypothetical protein SDC9_161399 [bioreactor metagenome]|uniref:Uncharacterized protein n=1 Tax=bioreactor metagenome TaxID=1076179 RepID=A0A645FPF4_9ZZZZ
MLVRNRTEDVDQSRFLFAVVSADELFDDRFDHDFVPEIIAPLEAAGFGVDDRHAALPELPDHAADVVSDDIGGAAGQYDKEVAVKHFERSVDHFPQPFFAAEDDLFFTGVGAGNCAASGVSQPLVAAVHAERTVKFVTAAGSGVGDRNRPGDRADRLLRAERAVEMRLFDVFFVRIHAQGSRK